ncbi:MAG TPA: SurA N-terminal domain-containing protein [Gallionella sp.]|nr:SurA N-terminal domain-containing protein [Gallionella sp.]
MFDFVREKKRLVQIVLAVIILPFAFWGVDSYNRAGNSADVVATVNGEKITRQEFDEALGQQQEQMRQMLGANFDAAMLDNPEMKHAVLDNLTVQRLLLERAKAAGLAVTDQQVAQLIAGIEAFQQDGKFDKARYEMALSSRNMNPPMFEARVNEDLVRQQMRDAYVQNGYVSNSVIDNIVRLNEQQRTVSISTIPVQSFVARAEVHDAAVQDYYKQNQKEFQLPEQARVEYVKFSADDLVAKANVAEADVRRYYDEHQQEFGMPEERRAAHILIAVAAAAPQADQDAAKAKAEKLLQQAKQDPARFAELAKANSEDPGSATNGGDLGFFGRSMMVKPFEDAAYALKQGEISGLVKSDFGYHIIKLVAIKPAQVPPYAAVRDSIAGKLRQQKAIDLFAEQAEKFSNTVYEQSDTLKPAAELVGAKIEQSGWLVKGANAAEPWTGKMLQAVFSDETVKNKRNTAAIEVGMNTLVAARILEHKPASVRALNEVQQAIRQKLIQQQALKLAAEQGKATLAQLLRGDKTALGWSPVQSITRARFGDLDVALVRQIFQASGDKFPQYVGAETGQGYVLVRIDAVKQGEAPDEMKRMRYAQQLRQLTGEELFQAYLSDAKKHADIELKLPEAVIMPAP